MCTCTEDRAAVSIPLNDAATAAGLSAAIVRDDYAGAPDLCGLALFERREDRGHVDCSCMEMPADVRATIREWVQSMPRGAFWGQVSLVAFARWAWVRGYAVRPYGDEFQALDVDDARPVDVFGVAVALRDDAYSTRPRDVFGNAFELCGLSAWAAWAAGEVYAWEVYDAEGDCLDSVSGYYGESEWDHMSYEAQTTADYITAEAYRARTAEAMGGEVIQQAMSARAANA